MAVVPTATEVIEEGQLQIGQFPTCGTSTGAFNTLVDVHIARAHIHVKETAPGLVNSGDADRELIANAGIRYMALSTLWTTIISTMIGYDAEELPPEFVDPAAAAELRDYYRQQAKEILAPYASSTQMDTGFALPVVGSVGISDDDESTPSFVERWANAGVRPE